MLRQRVRCPVIASAVTRGSKRHHNPKLRVLCCGGGRLRVSTHTAEVAATAPGQQKRVSSACGKQGLSRTQSPRESIHGIVCASEAGSDAVADGCSPSKGPFGALAGSLPVCKPREPPKLYPRPPTSQDGHAELTMLRRLDEASQRLQEEVSQA